MSADSWRFCVLLVLTGCASTAGRLGARGAEGASEALQKQIREVPPEEQGILAERWAAGAVRGALDELTTPHRERQVQAAIEHAVVQALRAITYGRTAGEDTGTGGSGPDHRRELSPLLVALGRQLSDGMVSGAVSRLEQALGPDGTGRLTETLAESGERMASSAVTGVQKGMPGLTGPCELADPFDCTKRRVQELGEAAATGMVRGFRWWLLLAAFVLGFLVNAAMREVARTVATLARRRKRST